jgi:hypothetical protein
VAAVTGETHDSRAAHALHELKQLAQAVISRLEPALRTIAESQASGPYPHSGCEWCPVCATVALLRGENHELLAFLAGHGAALAALLRQFVEEADPQQDNTDGERVAARFAEIVRDFTSFAGGLGSLGGQPKEPGSTAAAHTVGMEPDQASPAHRRSPQFEAIPVVIKI